jgi:hypothetical protein
MIFCFPGETERSISRTFGEKFSQRIRRQLARPFRSARSSGIFNRYSLSVPGSWGSVSKNFALFYRRRNEMRIVIRFSHFLNANLLKFSRFQIMETLNYHEIS